MLNVVTEFLDGFLTWQTPVSFLAGIGAAETFRRVFPFSIVIEKEDDVQKE